MAIEAAGLSTHHDARGEETIATTSNPAVLHGFRGVTREGAPAFHFKIFNINGDVSEELGSLVRKVEGYKVLRGVFYRDRVVVSFDVKHPLYLYEVAAKPSEPLTFSQRDRQPAIAFEARAEGQSLEILHNHAGEVPLDPKSETLVVRFARKLFSDGESRKHRKEHKKRTRKLKGFLKRNLPDRAINFKESRKVRI